VISLTQLIIRCYDKLPAQRRPIINAYYRIISKFIGQCRFLIIWLFLRNQKVKNINLFEKKIYSQNGEDGILQIIFYKIKSINKFCVEFGVNNGRECNTRYFIETEGWRYLHMDYGDYKHPYTQIKKEFITAENINLLFRKYNVPEEFNLLSIDIDFNDYWIWKAIEYYPAVVVIEYNGSIPPNESKVVKYEPFNTGDGSNYFGASLLALVKLGKSKGYTLVGCCKKGINAFFVRDDLINDRFVIKDIEELYKAPFYGKIINGRFVGHPPSNKSFISV